MPLVFQTMHKLFWWWTEVDCGNCVDCRSPLFVGNGQGIKSIDCKKSMELL